MDIMGRIHEALAQTRRRHICAIETYNESGSAGGVEVERLQKGARPEKG